MSSVIDEYIWLAPYLEMAAPISAPEHLTPPGASRAHHLRRWAAWRRTPRLHGAGGVGGVGNEYGVDEPFTVVELKKGALDNASVTVRYQRQPGGRRRIAS